MINCIAKNDSRVTSIFKIIISICPKNVEFWGKTSKFLPKRCLCLFIFRIFYLNENELNQQVCLIRHAENEISNSTFHKKKKKREREEQKHIQLVKHQFSNSWQIIISSLVTLVTNFHKLWLLPLAVRPWRKFEKQKLVLNFESCYCYFK